MAGSSSERFQQLALLFEKAITLAPSEREPFLTSACGTDTQLRDELDRLIAADGAVQLDAPAQSENLPRFGIYQAQERIGSGGMGAVYAATREDGQIEQRVAVKAISSALASPLLIERLRRERQILAGLNHPYIATFLDGGVTSDGHPYLVMEFVDGQPIDQWCDHRRLPVEERLKLFLKVCAAVAFAHQHLIVHRDLKPANILVTADGEPKLLDFGIAQTLGAELAATHSTHLFFTPLYSSPEVLRNQPASVTADVYSLGVLLYGLLVGAHPFSREAEPSPAGLIEDILASDPVPLKDAVVENAAGNRSETVGSLRRVLHGDLEAIVNKAIAKSPQERYGTVDQLEEEIRDYLAGRPVKAARPTASYVFRKWIRRHKALAIGAAVTITSLVAGLFATLWQARVADRRFAEAHEVARYLLFDVQRSVARLPGSTPLRAEIVGHSLDYLDRLSAERIRDESLRTEVGEAYAELAAVLGNPRLANLGEVAKARESYRKAIATLEPIAAANRNNRRARVALARTRLELGRSLDLDGKHDEGLRLMHNATNDFVAIAAQWPTDFEVHRQTAVAFDALSQALSQSEGYVNASNLDAAEQALQSAIDHAAAAARIKQDEEITRVQAVFYKRLGDLTELRDRAAATRFFREGLAVLEQIPPQDRETPLFRNARSSLLLGLGWNLGNLRDFEPAFAALQEAREMRDRISEEDPKNVMALSFRTIPYRNLGIVSGLAGKTSDQLHYFLQTCQIYDQLLAISPGNKTYRFGQAELRSNAANLMLPSDPREAARLARLAIDTMKETASNPRASAVELAITARSLLDTKVPGLRDPKLALSYAERSAAQDVHDSEVMSILGAAYWANGDRPGAIRSAEHALSLTGPTPTPERIELEKTLAKYNKDKPSLN